MIDPIFSKSVIYICAHDKKGAMGLIINKKIQNQDKNLVNYKDFELDPKIILNPLFWWTGIYDKWNSPPS